MSSKHQIKYVAEGREQTTRIISVADAEAAGFVLTEDLVWKKGTPQAILVDDLDQTAVDYFKGDPDFRIKDIGADEAKEKERSEENNKKPKKETPPSSENPEGEAGQGSPDATVTGGGGTATATTAPTRGAAARSTS
jgi:hypothetical protein